MIIDIDLLINNNLSPTLYVICKLIQNRDNKFNNFINNIYLHALLDLNFISIRENGDYQVSDKFIEIFNIPKKQAFDEIWESFPSSTPNGRKLKAYKKEDIAKKYYKEIKGDRSLHITILKCLEFEKNNSDLNYIRNIKTWIHNRTWEAYLEKIEQNSDKTQGNFI